MASASRTFPFSFFDLSTLLIWSHRFYYSLELSHIPSLTIFIFRFLLIRYWEFYCKPNLLFSYANIYPSATSCASNMYSQPLLLFDWLGNSTLHLEMKMKAWDKQWAFLLVVHLKVTRLQYFNWKNKDTVNPRQCHHLCKSDVSSLWFLFKKNLTKVCVNLYWVRHFYLKR